MFHDLMPSADFFFKINFFKNSFMNTIRQSNGSGLGPNCLQRSSADDIIFCSLLTTFANSLDAEQARQMVDLALGSIGLTL